MKSHLFIFAAIVAACISCNTKNEPTSPTPSPTPTPVVYTPKASFTAKVVQPMTVILTNNSTDALSYIWDFGDGQMSTDKQPVHTYTKIGIYEIKLTAMRDEKQSMATTKVTIEKPKHIFISGFTFQQVPYNNKYYYVKVIDDDFFTTTWLRTTATLLNNSILPYNFMLKNPVEMTGLAEDNYYVMQLYYNTEATGDGTLVEGYKIPTTKILEYPAGLIATGTNNKLTIYFEYE